MAREFDVYQDLIRFLVEQHWKVICASPPGGTDSRYPKCILPRRGPNEKGPRDEVDLSAARVNFIILAECKPTLSESLSSLNRLHESDYEKLKRIINSHSSIELARLFSQGYGVTIEADSRIGAVLAVSKVDARIPRDMTVIEFGRRVQLWTSESFEGVFQTP